MKKIIGFVATRTDVEFTFSFRNPFKWLQFEKHQIGSWVFHFWGFGNFDTFIKKGKDTEIIVGYSEPELNLLGTDKLRNRGAVIRIDQERLSIENDIIGAFQVFYGSADGNACVSSVEELVLQAIGRREIDRTNLVQYLLVGHLTCNHTLYREVLTLESNSRLDWTSDSFRVSSLPSLPFIEVQNPVDVLYETTRATIEKYVEPYDNIFLPLSGGYDSRLLAANMPFPDRVAARTYGYSYPLESSYEVTRARAVAEATGIKNWEPFDLGQDYIADYAWQWFDIFGTTHHLHGMYQLCFYHGVLGSGNSLIPTVSGYVGDAIVGHQLHEFSDVARANSEAKFFKAQYSGPLGFTIEELNSLLPWDINDCLSEIEHRWKIRWDNTEGADYQKFILTLLREPAERMSVLSAHSADLYGGVITPFIDRDYMATALSLPADSLNHRSAQEEVFRQFYPHVWFDNRQFPPYEHYLNFLAIKKRRHENIFPLLKGERMNTHDLFNDAFIEGIIEEYMGLCDHNGVMSGAWPIRSLCMCNMLQPIFYAEEQRLKDKDRHINEKTNCEPNLTGNIHACDKNIPMHGVQETALNSALNACPETGKSMKAEAPSATSGTILPNHDSTNSVPEHYNSDYFEWQKKIGAFGGVANLFKFANHIKTDDIVLDVGCGGGYLLNQINCKEKIGIEINEFARQICNGFNIKAYPSLTEINDNYVDVAISNHALEHLENPLKILRLLKKKLKEKGKAIFVIPHQDINEDYNANDRNNHLYTWNKQTLGNLFTQAGFNITSIDVIQHQWPPNYEKLFEEKGEDEFHKICREYAQRNHNHQIRIVAENLSKTPETIHQSRIKDRKTETPVILITYNRPRHTKRVLEALRQHKRNNIHIFSDGAKRKQDLPKVAETRELIHKIDWCEPVIIERQENFGLAKSITNAVNSVFEDYDSLILLEDDCLPQRYFFEFVEGCLKKYRSIENIFGICGYTVPIPHSILKNYPYDLYFYPRIGSWGWATWKRAWDFYDPDLNKLYRLAVEKNINLTQGGDDIPINIEKLLRGDIKDIWTLNWVLSVYLQKGFYIYPTKSHIDNIGNDGTGVHCGKTNLFNTEYADRSPLNFPNEIILDNNLIENYNNIFDRDKRLAAKNNDVNLNFSKNRNDVRTDKNKLKIVHINTHDILGGASKVACRLAQSQINLGHHAQMIVGKRDSNLSISSSFPALPDAEFQSRYKNNGMLDYELTGSHELVEHPSIKNADIIHLHNIHGYYFNPFSVVLLSNLKPTIWTLHDMQSFTGHCAHSLDCERWKQACGHCPYLNLYPALQVDSTNQLINNKKWVYDHSKLFITTPSNWLKEKVDNSILKAHPTKTVYNGVNTSVFKPYSKKEARRLFNLPENAFLVGCVAQNGAFSNPWKGGQYILEMLRILKSQSDNIIFVNVGENAPSNDPVVINIPWIGKESDLAQLYSALDSLILTSIADNCPLVALEAISCGLPVVAFDTGGIPEIIRDGHDGFIVKGKDVNLLAKCIIELARNSKLKNEFCQNARQSAVEKFDHKIIVKEYLSAYAHCISNWNTSEIRSFNPANLPEVLTTAGYRDYLYKLGDIFNQFDSQQSNYDIALKTLENVLRENKIEDAILILEKFISAYPNFALAHNDLGVLYNHAAKKDKAYNCYQRAVQLEPGNMIFQRSLADFYYVELGKVEDALQIYLKILDSNPKDIEILLLCGHICVPLHKFEDANVFYQRVLELEPQNEDAKSHLYELDKMRAIIPNLKSPQQIYRDPAALKQ